MDNHNNQNAEKTSPPADGCPAWADKLLQQLHNLEVQLGNIEETDPWQTRDISELVQHLQGDNEVQAAQERQTEHLFEKLVNGLTHEGYTPEEIAAFTNARVGAGGRLAYCNAEEVRQAIHRA